MQMSRNSKLRKKNLANSQTLVETLQTELQSVKNELADLQTELRISEAKLAKMSEQLGETETPSESSGNAETDNSGSESGSGQDYRRTTYHLKFGKLEDANPDGGADGNTLVIKAKIEPNLTNEMTISQNYHNIIDLVVNQGCDAYESIDYWAVADMADGTEGKVISFLVNKDCLSNIKNENIAATTLAPYLEDLWILPSLQ